MVPCNILCENNVEEGLIGEVHQRGDVKMELDKTNVFFSHDHFDLSFHFNINPIGVDSMLHKVAFDISTDVHAEIISPVNAVIIGPI